MAEGTRRRLDAGNLGRFRMAAQDRIVAAEAVENIDREESLVRQQHILCKTAVSLAQDASVAACPRRICRTVAQDLIVQYAHNFDKRQRRADVAAPPTLERTDDESSQIDRALIQRRGPMPRHGSGRVSRHRRSPRLSISPRPADRLPGPTVAPSRSPSLARRR